jgi:predicted dithiol-disulfide oxidoreductase (DUF899 family)
MTAARTAAAALTATLGLEKELIRMGDALARQRRELLVVYHFMFGPGYVTGCPACSSTADSLTGHPG